MIYHILYASSAVALFGKKDLKQILEAGRRHNHENGITGLLLYKGGNIIQLLEGEKEAVQETFARISEDKRHAGILVLSEGFNDARLFPEWRMGFRKAGDLENLAGFSDFLENDITSESFHENPNRVRVLLETFKEIEGLES